MFKQHRFEGAFRHPSVNRPSDAKPYHAENNDGGKRLQNNSDHPDIHQ